MSKKLLKFYILFPIIFCFGCEKKEVKEEQPKEIKKLEVK